MEHNECTAIIAHLHVVEFIQHDDVWRRFQRGDELIQGLDFHFDGHLRRLLPCALYGSRYRACGHDVVFF